MCIKGSFRFIVIICSLVPHFSLANIEPGQVLEKVNALLADETSYDQLKITRSIGSVIKGVEEPSIKTGFIIGGTNAQRFEYPEYALVLILDNAGEIVGSCGGTMIASNKVLTAGHCSQENVNNYVVIPSFYSFQDSVDQSDLFFVNRVVSHPEFDDITLANDVGVLTLSRNSFVATAPLLSGTNQLVRKQGNVIGTGLISTNPASIADVLQEVPAPITSNRACNAAWNRLAGIQPIQPNMMCAGFTTDARGSCSGDSGGALFIELDDERVIAGTVSFGIGECERNRATQSYARVSALTDFIRSESPTSEFIQFNAPLPAPIISMILSDESGTPTEQNRIEIPDDFDGEFFMAIERIPGDGGFFESPSLFRYTQTNANLRINSSLVLGITVEISGGAGIVGPTIFRTERQSLTMSPPTNQLGRLSVGVYENVQEFAGDNIFGLRVSSLARACSGISGRFRISEIAYNTRDELIKLVADFEQTCLFDGLQLNGAIDYDQARDDAVLPERSLPQGNPSPRLPRSGNILIAEGLGRAGNRTDTNIRIDSSSHSFSLSESGDGSEVRVEIRDNSNDPFNDYVLSLKRPNLDIDPETDTPLSPGIYEMSVNTSVSDGPLSGLTFGDGFGGCIEDSVGSFNIYEIEFGTNGQPVLLVADFEQRCRSERNVTRGSIRVDLRQ